MPTSPTPITALPTPPSRADSANFATRGDAFLGALPTFRTEANALATNAFNNAVEAEADAVAAAASAAASASSASASAVSASSSATSATAAAQNASAPAWVSGTTYSAGAVVYSAITQIIYRRRTAGGGTTDPSVDSANWAAAGPATPTMVSVSGASATANVNTHVLLIGSVAQTINAPANPAIGDVFTVTVANGRVDSTIGRNSQNIQGLAEDMVLDSVNASVTLRFAGATLGWRLV